MRLRSLCRPLRPRRARRPAAGGPFDIGEAHTVDGAAPTDVAAGYADRNERRIDHNDEFGNGPYVVSPAARPEHRDYLGRLVHSDREVARDGTRVLPGANVSDPPRDRSKNFRTPDVAFVLPGNTRCPDRDRHCYGRPAQVVEVEIPSDRARQKCGVYVAVGVREYLILDNPGRAPMLHRREHGGFAPVTGPRGRPASAVPPLAFQPRRPGRLMAKCTPGSRKRWTIGQ